MIWLYILIFIPLITATRRRDEPTYRSNVKPGNKTILILYAKPQDYSEFDPEHRHSQPQMLRNNVPNGFNEDDKPVLRMPSDDSDDFVPSFNDGDKPVLRLPSHDNDDLDLESSLKSKTLRTKHKKKKKEKEKLREQIIPDWVPDLKSYMKDLTSHYGLEEVLQRAKPVIKSIEKKQHVKVKDVDVDAYGEIHVTYIEKKKNKKKSVRQGNNTDDDT